MGETATLDNLTSRLEGSPLRAQFVDHEFFRRVRRIPLVREQAGVCVGQWWHPLHYFPTFLARCVAVVPDIESKSAIAVILSQESGEGNADRAHEVIYVDTMESAGFTREEIVEAPAFPETAALVDGYERLSASAMQALGAIFATEVTDLMMVSSIGNVVTRATGARYLEWVKIHIAQEPDHVEEANHALVGLSAEEEAAVVDSAEEMWRLWNGFFDRLDSEICTRAAGLVAARNGAGVHV